MRNYLQRSWLYMNTNLKLLYKKWIRWFWDWRISILHPSHVAYLSCMAKVSSAFSPYPILQYYLGRHCDITFLLSDRFFAIFPSFSYRQRVRSRGLRVEWQQLLRHSHPPCWGARRATPLVLFSIRRFLINVVSKQKSPFVLWSSRGPFGPTRRHFVWLRTKGTKHGVFSLRV